MLCMEPLCILSRMKVWEELLDEEGRDGGCRRNAMFAPRAGVPRRLKARRGVPGMSMGSISVPSLSHSPPTPLW